MYHLADNHHQLTASTTISIAVVRDDCKQATQS